MNEVDRILADQNPTNDDQRDVDHSESVMRLYSQHQRWLFGYLTSLLGSPNDAEDVMQEVCVVMWQQHEKFKIGTSFVSWLSVIAYHQVQKFWREKKKRRGVLNLEMIDQLSAQMAQDFDLLEARRRALTDCVGRLHESDRELVSHCYGSRKRSAKTVAEQLGRPTNTVYKALKRIRKSLFECITRQVSAEGIA
jgi:RNA polymerase sigma-70 factor (ECF subfamily)